MRSMTLRAIHFAEWSASRTRLLSSLKTGFAVTCRDPSGIRQRYPYWAKDPKIGLRTINAKAETITTAPAFREAIKYRGGDAKVGNVKNDMSDLIEPVSTSTGEVQKADGDVAGPGVALPVIAWSQLCVSLGLHA
jgi:hypothetical protein